MCDKNKNIKLKKLVEDSTEINIQLKKLLFGLKNLEDVIKYSENISDRVSKAFALYNEFINIIKE